MTKKDERGGESTWRGTLVIALVVAVFVVAAVYAIIGNQRLDY